MLKIGRCNFIQYFVIELALSTSGHPAMTRFYIFIIGFKKYSLSPFLDCCYISQLCLWVNVSSLCGGQNILWHRTNVWPDCPGKRVRPLFAAFAYLQWIVGWVRKGYKMILLPMGLGLRADNMICRPKSSRQISAKTNTPSSRLALRMPLVKDLNQPGNRFVTPLTKSPTLCLFAVL